MAAEKRKWALVGTANWYPTDLTGCRVRRILPSALDQALARSVKRRRSARRAARRRARLARVALAASVFFLVVAFFAGLVWGQGRWRKGAEAVSRNAVAPAQRAQARLLLDRAVEARHADLPGDAMRLAMEGKNIDPDLPGVDLFAAEMALRQNNPNVAEAAARRALQQLEGVADAKLILAVNAWMLRGQSGVDSAGATSQQLLAEAGDAELSNASVRFFAGDLQRATGRPSEAHRSLLGGLYRQEPWHSAAVLGAKLALAVDQAGGLGGEVLSGSGEESATFGKIAEELARARREDKGGLVEALWASLTGKQIEILSRDPALPALALAIQDSGVFLPFGEVESPTNGAKTSHMRP